MGPSASGVKSGWSDVRWSFLELWGKGELLCRLQACARRPSISPVCARLCCLYAGTCEAGLDGGKPEFGNSLRQAAGLAEIDAVVDGKAS